MFVSSCFVGLQKPEPDIYRLALETAQTRAEEKGCFVDDPGSESGVRPQAGNADH